MRFLLSGQQEEFAKAIDSALSTVDSSAAALDGGEYGVWHRLDALGITQLLRDGGDTVDLSVAMRRIGYHAVPGPVVETVAVLPRLGQGEPLSPTTIAFAPQVPLLLDADTAEQTLAVVDGKVHVVTAIGELVRSVDPARRLFPVRDIGPALGAAHPTAFDHGVLAVSAQLLGLGEWLLETAADYAKVREQYGKPIGQYQAIKHLLADVACALEFAEPLLHGAAIAADTPTFARDVSAARVACADAAYDAALACLQVHGAVGYTTEHPLSSRLTKVRALRGAWGTQAWHRNRVLDALTDAGKERA